MAQIDRRVYNDSRFGHARGNPVSIRFEGRDLRAFDGEPVSVALYASGIDIVSRSLKFHRPRGIFCAKGHCGRCLMRIDGVPNQNGCRVRCAQDMAVLREPGYPSADYDLLGASDVLFREKLDYHHMATSTQASVRALTRLVRGVSGLGELPEALPTNERTIGELRADVLVIGGGMAGLCAAMTLAEAGVDATLVDAGAIGGRLLDSTRADKSEGGHALARRLGESLRAQGVRVLADSEAIGFYDEGFGVVRDAGGLKLATAKRYLVCTGSYDQSALFEQNDLPGILSARAAASLLVRFGVRPGARAIIWGDGDNGAGLAQRLIGAGVEVAALASPRDRLSAPDEDIEALKSAGIPIFTNQKLRAAKGRRRVTGVVFDSASGVSSARSGRCDTLILDLPTLPAYEIAAQAGARVEWDAGRKRFALVTDENGRTTRPDVYVAGEAAGSDANPEVVETDAARVARAVIDDLRGGSRP